MRGYFLRCSFIYFFILLLIDILVKGDHLAPNKSFTVVLQLCTNAHTGLRGSSDIVITWTCKIDSLIGILISTIPTNK